MNIIKSAIIGLGISVVLGSGAAFAAGDMPEHYRQLGESIRAQGQAAMQMELKQVSGQVLAQVGQAGELAGELARHERNSDRFAAYDHGYVHLTGAGDIRIRVELPNISLPRLVY